MAANSRPMYRAAYYARGGFSLQINLLEKVKSPAAWAGKSVAWRHMKMAKEILIPFTGRNAADFAIYSAEGAT